MSNGARIFLMNSEVLFSYMGWLQRHLVGWCPGLGEVSVSMGGLSVYIGGYGPVRLLDNEYI